MTGQPLAVAVAVAVAVTLGACGDDGSPTATGTCGGDMTEPLDPGSARHVLPGAPEPDYASDPPTSGAHLPGAGAGGARRQPLSRPEQVAVLEEGGVVLQHRDLDDRDRRRLEALAADDIVVAPNAGLDVPVMATAWRQRLRCQTVDAPALRAFIDAHRGGGPAAA